MDTDRLLNQLEDALPNIIGAILILVIGYIVARVLSSLVRGAVSRTGLDDRISRALGGPAPTDGAKAAGTFTFWLVMLLVLGAFLGATGLDGVTEPLNSFVSRFLAFIPRLIGAVVLLIIAFVLARIVRTLLQRALGAARIDERLGTATPNGGGPLSRSLAEAGFFLVLLFFLPAVLDALGLQGLLAPVQGLIDRILAFLPNLAAAIITLVVAFFVGRVLSQLLSGVLAGIGFDQLPQRLGLGQAAAPGGQPPSRIAGQLVLALIMLFASIEALDALGFESLSGIVTAFLALIGRVILGLLIFGAGFALARFAAGAVRSSGVANAGALSTVAQAAILVLAGAMALRQMGFAEDIVNLAFGLLLGAVAVAAALAFGLGGREVAGQQLRRFVEGSKSGG